MDDNEVRPSDCEDEFPAATEEDKVSGQCIYKEEYVDLVFSLLSQYHCSLKIHQFFF